MGFNSVAVILNDHSSQISNDAHIGYKIYNAMMNFIDRKRDRFLIEAGGGIRIISQAHADTPQVVVVGMNTGEALTLDHPNDTSQWALDAIAWELTRRGYKVTKPKK